jgi:CO/xanthine dehydrogenase FAD-binding subunit
VFMKLRSLPDFEYFAPKDVREACRLLKEHDGRAKVMAGGTDLLVHMKHRTVVPQYVIGLKHLPDLGYIEYNEDRGLRIGTLATHQSVAENPLIKERFGALGAACSKVGTPQIRSMGTVGGNLCNGSPSSDSAPPLIALNAAVKLQGLEGERVIPLEAFFVGPGETTLRAGEILTEIQVPSPSLQTQLAYMKLPARTAVDMAAVSAAVFVTLDSKNEICHDIRIVLGAVAPTPLRARRAEEVLKRKKIEDTLIQQAARLASEEAQPISDIRSSADYRKEMVKVLTKQAIRQALAQATSA